MTWTWCGPSGPRWRQASSPALLLQVGVPVLCDDERRIVRLTIRLHNHQPSVGRGIEEPYVGIGLVAFETALEQHVRRFRLNL